LLPQLGDLRLEVLTERHRSPGSVVLEARGRSFERCPVTEQPHHVNKQLPVIEVCANEVNSPLQVGQGQQIDSDRLRLRDRRQDAGVYPGSNGRLRHAEDQRCLGNLGPPLALREVAPHLVESATLAIVDVTPEVLELQQVVDNLGQRHGL
jgi:hypothetical protein